MVFTRERFKCHQGVMPIPCPHFKITIVKRSQGQSAVAGAAYQSGERLFSEYDQKTKFYNKKKELVHAEIMLPSHSCLLEQRGRPAVTCRGGGPSILLTQDRSVDQKPHWGFCCCANASLPWQAEQAHHAPSKEKQSVPDGERPVVHIFGRVRPGGRTLFFYYASSFSARSIRYPTPT